MTKIVEALVEGALDRSQKLTTVVSTIRDLALEVTKLIGSMTKIIETVSHHTKVLQYHQECIQEFVDAAERIRREQNEARSGADAILGLKDATNTNSNKPN